MTDDNPKDKKITPKSDYFHLDKNKNRYLDLTKKSTHASSNHYENNITHYSNAFCSEENKFKIQYEMVKKETSVEKKKKTSSLKIILKRKKPKYETMETEEFITDLNPNNEKDNFNEKENSQNAEELIDNNDYKNDNEDNDKYIDNNNNNNKNDNEDKINENLTSMIKLSKHNSANLSKNNYSSPIKNISRINNINPLSPNRDKSKEKNPKDLVIIKKSKSLHVKKINKTRRDYFGTEIKKNSKSHKVKFIDTLNDKHKKRLVEVVRVQSFKKFNTIEEKIKEDKTVCNCKSNFCVLF